jgi:hypothetical protein
MINGTVIDRKNTASNGVLLSTTKMLLPGVYSIKPWASITWPVSLI